MRQAIVITTWHGGAEPTERLLRSLDGVRWPLVIVVNGAADAPADWLDSLARHGRVLLNLDDRYELGAISAVMERTDLDEFVLLQDTFEVKDGRVFDMLFAHPYSVALGVAGFHYAWKFRRSILAAMDIPVVTTKRESVRYEGEFARDYWSRDPHTWLLDPHFHDGEHAGFVDMFGRTNMVLENQWFIKRKGDWGQRPL